MLETRPAPGIIAIAPYPLKQHTIRTDPRPQLYTYTNSQNNQTVKVWQPKRNNQTHHQSLSRCVHSLLRKASASHDALRLVPIPSPQQQPMEKLDSWLTPQKLQALSAPPSPAAQCPANTLPTIFMRQTTVTNYRRPLPLSPAPSLPPSFPLSPPLDTKVLSSGTMD